MSVDACTRYDKNKVKNYKNIKWNIIGNFKIICKKKRENDCEKCCENKGFFTTKLIFIQRFSNIYDSVIRFKIADIFSSIIHTTKA